MYAAHWGGCPGSSCTCSYLSPAAALSGEHKLSLFKGAVDNCVTFTTENTCKLLTSVLSFRKNNLEKKYERDN